jgi:ABC-type transport system involved in multi-copper enzyme maturation permease subunit
MNTTVWTICRFTVLELLRSRGLWLCFGAMLAVASVGIFAGALALTEHREIMTSSLAPLARICCVALVALLGTTSVVRDIQERTWLLTLAAPVSRRLWLLGKWLGLAIAATVCAALLSIPVLALHTGLGGWLWSLSLILEAVLVSALVVATALSFKQVPATLFATVSFYFAARVVGLVKLLNDRAPLENTGVQTLSNTVIDSLALLLPRLDMMTSTMWLLSAAPRLSDIAFVVAQVALYCAIALSAASIDLTRKDLAV